jgi:hypothetical protein
MRKPKQFWNSLVRTTFKRHRLDDAISPQAFIGKSVFAHRGGVDGELEEVQIASVQGSKDKDLQKYLEINGSHLCHTLSFFSQLMENRLPSDEEIAEFELATQITKIKEIKDGSTQGQ